MLQAEVTAWQEQKQDKSGKHQLIPHDRGRTWWGHCSVRQGWEGGLGTDWGHVFPL